MLFRSETILSPNPSDVITDNEAESMSPDFQVKQETMPMNLVRRSISPQVLSEQPTQQPVGRRETNMHSGERGTRERERRSFTPPPRYNPPLTMETGVNTEDEPGRDQKQGTPARRKQPPAAIAVCPCGDRKSVV